MLSTLHYIATSLLRAQKAVLSTNSVPVVHTFVDSPRFVRRFMASDKSQIDKFRKQEEQRDEQDKAADSSQNPTTNELKRKNVAAIRESILKASLPFVLKYGWTRESIQQGATIMNYPGIAHGLFPNGGIELINHFVLSCDRRLVKDLTEKPKPTKDDGPKVLPEFAFVARAIRKRIVMLESVRDRWPQAMAMRALPPHAFHSLEQTLRMVDDICYLAGDRSANVSISSLAIYSLFLRLIHSFKTD